jgi:N-methylhydantoinase A
VADGVQPEQIDVKWLVDMRYIAQEYSLPVPLELAEVDDPDFATIVADRFHQIYDARYGHANPSAPVEFVSLRATTYGDLGRAEAKRLNGNGNGAGAVETGTREVVFGRRAQQATVAVRDDLPAGTAIDGPVIVEEPTATTVVPPGWTASVDDLGFLILTAEGR